MYPGSILPTLFCFAEEPFGYADGRQVGCYRLFQLYLCKINIHILFSFLSEEQLEEDKLHSNGGKVLSSELKNTHFGSSPSIILPLLLSLSHPTESLVVVEVSLCHDSCSFAFKLFCLVHSSIFLTFLLHPFMLNLLHIIIFEHHCTTNTFTSDNSGVNSSFPN